MSALKFIRSLPYRIDLAVKLQIARWSRLRSPDNASLELPDFPPIHKAASEFLERYGGFTLHGRSTIILSPMSCVDDHCHVQRYRDIDNRNYYPVGMIDDECATVILVDDDGSIYLFAAPPGSDGGPWFVGRSLFDSAYAVIA